MNTIFSFLLEFAPDGGTLLFLATCFFIVIYSAFRFSWWKEVLGYSLNYHRFHLDMILNDRESGEKTKGYAQAMLWAINKQLPLDLGEGKGGRVLWRSFIGDKTCINTCGTIFYELARLYPREKGNIIKLNDTLLSIFYRICFIESFCRPIAVVYMDMALLFSFITKPSGGTGRLYREMVKEMYNRFD